MVEPPFQGKSNNAGARLRSERATHKQGAQYKKMFTGNETDIVPGLVAVVGVPYDEQSSFLRGAARAPAQIRDALACGSSNWCTEAGVDLAAEARFRDLGDLELGAGEAALQQIEQAVAACLQRGARVLALGGDHAITYPIVTAYAQQAGPINLLHFDAHPDLYDEFEGNRYSHACPFARILEDGLAKRLVQVGIRAMTPAQAALAQRFGAEIIDMRRWPPSQAALTFDGPVYVSLDLDVLDPGFAPGLSHYEPGGLSPREVLRTLHALEAPLLGADIVECNPARDPSGLTAMTAAKFLKELAGKMLGAG